MVIFAWSPLQATVTDHCIREVMMRLAARHMGLAMELVPLVVGNGLGICAVDGGSVRYHGSVERRMGIGFV